MSKLLAASEGPKRSKSERGIAAKASASGIVTSFEDQGWTAALNYLGGSTFWSRRPNSRIDVDAVLASGGLSHGAVSFLLRKVDGLTKNEVAEVLAVSTRTLRRWSATPEKRLPAIVAARVWLLAETLAKAAYIFGGEQEAERWMSRPASGLDGRRPIDLLQSPREAELVGDFLGRLEYCVYC